MLDEQVLGFTQHHGHCLVRAEDRASELDDATIAIGRVALTRATRCIGNMLQSRKAPVLHVDPLDHVDVPVPSVRCGA